MTGATGGKQDLLHSPDHHKIPSCHSAHQTKGPQTHLPHGTTSRRRRPPEKKLHSGSTTSTSSPMTPERNAKGARKSSRGLIPTERRRRRRLAGDARNPNPRDPRTYTTTPHPPAREKRSRPPHDAPRAIGGGGDRRLRRRHRGRLFFPSVNCSGTRAFERGAASLVWFLTQVDWFGGV